MRRLLVSALLALPHTVLAQAVPLVPVHGSRCQTLAPQGWRVVNESPDSNGVDLVSGDGKLVASYSIIGISGAMQNNAVPGSDFRTPQAAAYTIWQQYGQNPARFGTASKTKYGYNRVAFQNAYGAATGLWTHFSAGNSMDPQAYVIVQRAGAVLNGAEARRLNEALAVANSIRCNVAFHAPPPADYTSDLLQKKQRPAREEEAASDYNKELGMETVHNPQTGQNYWVSPSTDYRENGPQGPGYYTRVGNWEIKLAPGRVD